MYKIGRLILSIALVATYFLGTIHPSFACSCMMPPAPMEAMTNSAVVFAGEVTDVSAAPAGGVISSADPIPVTFKVSRVWKGAPDPFMTVRTARDSASCGFEFQAGQEYLVYAWVSDGLLETGLCSRTALLADAADDLAALGEGEIPVEEAAPGEEVATETEGPFSFFLSTWSLGVVAVLFLLAILFLVTRRAAGNR